MTNNPGKSSVMCRAILTISGAWYSAITHLDA
jgi:hypothetical protein